MAKRTSPEAVRFELAGIVRQFLLEYELGSPDKTLAYYRDNVGRSFLNAMTQRKVTDLLQVTPEVLRDFLAEEIAGSYTIGSKTKRRSATTVSSRQVAVGTFLEWCVSQDYIPTSPMRKVKRIPRAASTRVGYEVEEVQRMTREASRAPGWLGARDHAMVVVLLDTGARAAGLLNLKTVGSFNWKRLEVTLFEKGSKTRVVPISKKTAAAVKAYVDVRPDVHWENLWLNNRNEPMNYGALSMP